MVVFQDAFRDETKCNGNNRLRKTPMGILYTLLCIHAHKMYTKII